MEQSTNGSGVNLLRPFKGGMTVNVDEGVNRWLAQIDSLKTRD